MNRSISLARAIGIILMVIGHTECPSNLRDFIYMFHMPLFFFLSGWCFKEKYINSTNLFIQRKVTGLYLPFVFIALCFLFLHNTFLNIGLIKGELYSYKTIFDRTKSIIVSLHKEEQLIGGFWFIPQLFYASFIFFIVIKYIRHRLIGILLMSIAAILCKIYDFSIPYTGIGFVSFYGAIFMMFGFILKNRNYKLNSLLLALILFLVVAAGAFFIPSVMFIRNVYYFIPYMFVALSGSILVLVCAQWLDSYAGEVLNRHLCFIGNNTLYILTLHYLAFKLISLLLIEYYSLPITYLGDETVLKAYTNNWVWILYSIFGVLVPVFIAYLIDAFKRCLPSKSE